MPDLITFLVCFMWTFFFGYIVGRFDAKPRRKNGAELLVENFLLEERKKDGRHQK